MIEVLPILDTLLAYVGAPHADFMPPPARFTTGAGVFGVCMSGGTFFLIELALLGVLECFPKLMSDFAARKVCHSCSGLLFLTLDSTSAAARGAMYMIGLSSILMTWEVTTYVGIKAFRFGSTRDIGISVYLALVMLWFFGELPPIALSPMFFADPAGAVIGKWLTRICPKYNRAWYEKKTVGGSMAVFVFSLLTLALFYPPMPPLHLLALSLAAPVAEAVGGSYDNLLLAGVVIGGYYLLEGSGGTTPSMDLSLLGIPAQSRPYAAPALLLGAALCSTCGAIARRRATPGTGEDGDCPTLYSELPP